MSKKITLGSRQLGALRALARGTGQRWQTDVHGWAWGTWQQTVDLMESLARKGLVDKQPPDPAASAGYLFVAYALNDAGRQWLKENDGDPYP